MTRTFRPGILLLASAAALLLAGCGGAPAQSSPAWEATGGKAAAVTIQTFQFRPEGLDVKAGTRVTWTNTDDIEHTVTSGTPDGPDGRLNTPLDGKGATFSYTFAEPGTYPYFCDRHTEMRGEIRVN
jgi:plastocyanin